LESRVCLRVHVSISIVNLAVSNPVLR